MRTPLLLLITDLGLGGAPLVVRDLAANLDHDRFAVRVACLAPPGPIAHDLQRLGIPTDCLGATGPTDPRIPYRLARFVAAVRPTILHCHLVHANVLGRLVGSLMRVPHIIATIHTAEQHQRWHLTAEKLTCRLSDVSVCVSPSVARHTRRFAGVPASRLRVITNGIDIDRFADAPAVSPADLTSLGLTTGRKTIVSVGRLDSVKALDVLLHALALLPDQLDPQLLIVGDGPERPRLQRLVTRLSLQQQVFFAGPRRDVPAILKAAELFVMPSLFEGFGLAALEAMAAGLPVIATRTAGLTDLIDSNSTGLLVPTGNPQQLAQAITTLLSDPPRAARLATAAGAHARDHFSLHRTIAEYTALYRQLLTTHRR